MKAFKISLAVAFVAVIGFFAVKSLVTIGEKGDYEPPINQFTEKLNCEIDTVLPKMPDSNFCPEKYAEIKWLISTWHKENRLGKDKLDTLGNRLSKEFFESNLYAAYAHKFYNQAFYVFDRNEWNPDDLNFIRSEYQTLQKSSFLQAGSRVAKKFDEIRQIFAKYDEINVFIASCKNFGYSGTSLSDRFPVSEVQGKIQQTANYRNNWGKSYVNNCTRLHDGLREAPQLLFQAHVRYLDKKIDEWTGLYSNYHSQKEYKELFYDKLKAEIDRLDSSAYNVGDDTVDREYQRLKNKLDTDSRDAYNYFSNKQSNL
ncbi:MAG: hypothetical protein LBP83_07965 [Dysgonamonadaceae bacterium]|jgi:hypothetical protein|nr:hypothetical protein [Dysgonamonadaceae bacterium]